MSFRGFRRSADAFEFVKPARLFGRATGDELRCKPLTVNVMVATLAFADHGPVQLKKALLLFHVALKTKSARKAP